MADMPKLRWFPNDALEYLGDEVVQTMKIEQEGAYWRLLNQAWKDGTKEPSLPADDESLAFLSKLGERWFTLGQLVRAQFVERDGRLYHPRLSKLWADRLNLYQIAANKGRRGGTKKGDNHRKKTGQPASSAIAQLEPPRRSSDLTSLRGTLASIPLGSSSAIAGLKHLDVVVTTTTPETAPPVVGRRSGEPTTTTTDVAQLELAIGVKVDEYRRLHPDHWAAFESDVRAELRIEPGRLLLPPDQQQAVERRMAERIDAHDTAPRHQASA